MIVHCPTCGYVMSVEDGSDGMLAECLKCHKEFVVGDREPKPGVPERSVSKARRPVKAVSGAESDGGMSWTLAAAALVMAICTMTFVLNGQRPLLATFGIVLSVFAIGRSVRDKAVMATVVAAVSIILFAWAGISASGEIDRAARSLNHAAMNL